MCVMLAVQCVWRASRMHYRHFGSVQQRAWIVRDERYGWVQMRARSCVPVRWNCARQVGGFRYMPLPRVWRQCLDAVCVRRGEYWKWTRWWWPRFARRSAWASPRRSAAARVGRRAVAWVVRRAAARVPRAPLHVVRQVAGAQLFAARVGFGSWRRGRSGLAVHPQRWRSGLE